MSKKQTPLLPEDLENELQDYFATPEPGSEFILRLERGLHSKLKEQEQKKMSRRSKVKLAWGLGLALAAVLIGFLVTSPTIVAAMKRLWSYIPGVGIVESGSPLRVLAEPVSQTRDGITVTVKEAFLSSDKTVIVFTVENVPFDKLSHAENVPGCMQPEKVILPGGAALQSMAGSGTGWGTGYEMRESYSKIPADVNDATFVLPCIRDVLPGVLPENWELPLHFVPAPPDMTALPVTEYTPSPAPEAAAGPEQSNPISISKVIDTGDAYILIGEFDPPAPSETGAHWSSSLRVTDGNDQEVFWDFPQDIDLPFPDPAKPYSEIWSIKISKGFVSPLHLIYSSQAIFPAPREQYEFEFDAGADPQPGQTWELNKEIHLSGHAFTLQSIAIVPPSHGGSLSGYAFSFVSNDDRIHSVTVNIAGYNSAGAGGGGGGGAGQTSWSTEMHYEQLPKGNLKIVLSDLFAYGDPQEWILDWQPGESSSSVSPVSTEAPQACLTLDSWQAALTNSAPIPADLTGKVIAYGRIVEDGQNPSPDNFGIYVADLDGSNNQVIGPGVWPSLSPDGKRAAYAWSDGLYIADLATGESRLIPNTNGNDYNPRWSPDGTRLAFVRIDDFNLYLINPDGTGLQRVINEIDYEQLVDWSPDGRGLFYGVDTQQGISLRKLDIASGAITSFFIINSKGTSFSISPDGNQIAFMERTSTVSYSLYVSRLDGSDRELLGNMGSWTMISPVWSPDGNWLMLGILDNALSTPEPTLALVNVKNCQIIPLALNGDVTTWIP